MNDGLGFEEVNKEVTFTEIISGTYFYGAGSVVTPKIGATNVAITGSLTDALGLHRTVAIGSPATYGARIYVNRGVTSAGSGVFISAGTVLPSTSYYVIGTPGSVVASAVPLMASGVRSTSGVNGVGTASTYYDWMIIVP
jgi:hypothetical protein